jgi:2-amino-4-hydroxy-6-hydroxymethyldihydropteridine diphosphokinase
MKLLIRLIFPLERVELKSSIYETKSWGFKSSNFYNTCLLVDSSLSVELILNKILKIEKDMGRLNSRDPIYR